MALASPAVRLGALRADGIAPSVFALVERGATRLPALVAELDGEVELLFSEGFAPVRIVFGAGEVLVEDGEAADPDLVISGALPDFVHLTTAPLVAGAPSPFSRRGWSALARVANGRVRIDGD